MALRRLQAELLDLGKNPVENVSIGPVDDSNVLHWKGQIMGPNNSPYKGGIFKVELQFNTDYPFKPPKVKFLTKIYHPNIDEEGAICVALLKNDQWKPATRINQVLRALVTLLEQPNPDDPLMTDIAEIYSTDQARFQKTAKEYTKKAAQATYMTPYLCNDTNSMPHKTWDFRQVRNKPLVLTLYIEQLASLPPACASPSLSIPRFIN
ncbi:hypothetical protein BGX27_007942 [Mortierella sp. AM989]|nr:hypothetical protein BGX27_007942 [Mortierella sp. AM989]